MGQKNAAEKTVCENRNKGIEKLMSMPEPPQIVVLDDVFQHRYVNPTVNILLTEYGNPFFNVSVMIFCILFAFVVSFMNTSLKNHFYL